ncbi:helix-turn-helix domain-containing protein [Algicola sagamiensis]|uniref:helix-turn-helix domain-containing protein n=1 Tax=Algicola sagamiensis TaxID=163869 RepID=UPI000380ACE1|nr:helix-turn-helix domain-containing protein [Algicola sagamiensis]
MTTENIQISTKEIVSRMCETWKVKEYQELASILNLNRTAISNWIRRETIPVKECIYTAQQKGVSLDWLILGDKPQTHVVTTNDKLEYAVWESLSTAFELGITDKFDKTQKVALGRMVVKRVQKQGDILKPESMPDDLNGTSD